MGGERREGKKGGREERKGRQAGRRREERERC